MTDTRTEAEKELELRTWGEFMEEIEFVCGNIIPLLPHKFVCHGLLWVAAKHFALEAKLMQREVPKIGATWNRLVEQETERLEKLFAPKGKRDGANGPVQPDGLEAERRDDQPDAGHGEAGDANAAGA